MYFTDTPSLGSVEAIMKRPPGVSQRGGGRNRSPYRYTKDDCDCRLCLHYRKKNGCTAEICPVLDIRLGCGGASLSEAVKSAFAGARHIPFQRRLSKLYNRKDVEHMIFQSNRHKQIFEAGRLNLHKPSNQALAALYLLQTIPCGSGQSGISQAAVRWSWKASASEISPRTDMPSGKQSRNYRPAKGRYPFASCRTVR